MKHVEHHAHDLSFHLAHTGKDIGMDRVGDGKLAKGFGLQANEVVFAVIDCSRDETILPTGVVEVGQILELGADSIHTQALLGQGQVPRVRLCNEFGGHLSNGLGDLFLDLATHTWCAEKITVQGALDCMVQLEDGADQASTLELPESSSGPSEDKVVEDDISESR